MVSETEAIAELSCTREHPSLIHYAARYGQVIHTRAHKHTHAGDESSRFYFFHITH